MAYDKKPKRHKKYSVKEKSEIVKKFRENLDKIFEPKKSLDYVQMLVRSQIESKGYIDLKLSDHISPYLVGEALLSLNRNSSRGLDRIDIYYRIKQGIRVCRAIARRVQRKKYSPAPYKIIEILKDPDDPTNTRKIGIFSTTEKTIQYLLKSILEPIYEPEFLPNSFAYRPGKSPERALEYLSERLKAEDHRLCIKIDIKKYFDSIDHKPLLRILEEKVKSPEIISYVESFLKSSRLEKYHYIENSRGTPQGSVLGPLLSNIYLHEILDKLVIENFPHIEFVRFADDIVFFTKTREEADKLLFFVKSSLINYNLGISDKITKTIYDLEKEEVYFLGYKIYKDLNGIQISVNEMRIIERCEKYLNIFYLTITKYKDYSVIDLRKCNQEQITKIIRRTSIYHQIDRFIDSIQKYSNKTYDQSNILIEELEKVKLELKEILFNNITERKDIWNVIHYFENRIKKLVLI
ncbi:reverse transcriptase domain-containing protein [Leptospira licerasiae]|uniref:reverse transcriptase domain-containing protein n=2 Tax=Leptospira TaxID=171 RepID=UPI00301845FF